MTPTQPDTLYPTSHAPIDATGHIARGYRRPSVRILVGHLIQRRDHVLSVAYEVDKFALRYKRTDIIDVMQMPGRLFQPRLFILLAGNGVENRDKRLAVLTPREGKNRQIALHFRMPDQFEKTGKFRPNPR
jgi:hypothetical protein